MKHLLLTLLFAIAFCIYGQQLKKVLFIGNSYTGVNNLPQMTANVAASMGDSLIFDSHTPGGRRFLNHAVDPAVMSKIFSRNWDFVSLQGQSQEVAFDSMYFYQDVYYNVQTLCDTIRANNACSQPLFYTTWGRQNGDPLNCPFMPYMCTYQGMDSALTANYTILAQDNEAELSPVGPVWNFLRSNHPSINLYAGDGSHPSLAGSYAAACTFYTMIFKKDPLLISWNSSLNSAIADTIKMAVRLNVYDSLAKWNFSSLYPLASFTYQTNGLNVQFNIDSLSSIDSVRWDLGDSTQSTLAGPQHLYTGSGNYTVQLNVYNCGKVDSTTQLLSLSTNGLQSHSQANQPLLYPNPVEEILYLNNAFAFKSIRVFNQTGKLVFSDNSITQQLDLSKLKTGIYFVQLIGEESNYTSKIIKE